MVLCQVCVKLSNFVDVTCACLALVKIYLMVILWSGKVAPFKYIELCDFYDDIFDESEVNSVKLESSIEILSNKHVDLTRKTAAGI